MSCSPILLKDYLIKELAEPERRFTLSPSDIARINPNTKTVPVFRSRADAELTARIYTRVPVLIDEANKTAGNLWGVSFMAMFHMSNDSGLFRTAANLREAGFVREGSDWVRSEGLRPVQDTLNMRGGRDDRSFALDGGVIGHNVDRFIPLYEAKMIHHFNHRYGDFLNAPEKDETEYREIPQADATTLADPNYEPTSRYWVPDREVRLTASRPRAGPVVG